MPWPCQTGREIARELRDGKEAFDRLEIQYRGKAKSTAYFRERAEIGDALRESLQAFNQHRKICHVCGHTASG
jgi:hypothetical protein